MGVMLWSGMNVNKPLGCWCDAGTVKSGVGGARLRERRRGEDEDKGVERDETECDD